MDLKNRKVLYGARARAVLGVRSFRLSEARRDPFEPSVCYCRKDELGSPFPCHFRLEAAY